MEDSNKVTCKNCDEIFKNQFTAEEIHEDLEHDFELKIEEKPEPETKEFIKKCLTCPDFEVKSDTDEKADELMKIHMMEHRDGTHDIADAPPHPFNMSLSTVIAISIGLFALGFGLMFATGKIKMKKKQKEFKPDDEKTEDKEE